MVTNLKWVLTCFEQVLVMRTNYNKSEIIPLGLALTKSSFMLISWVVMLSHLDI